MAKATPCRPHVALLHKDPAHNQRARLRPTTETCHNKLATEEERNERATPTTRACLGALAYNAPYAQAPLSAKLQSQPQDESQRRDIVRALPMPWTARLRAPPLQQPASFD